MATPLSAPWPPPPAPQAEIFEPEALVLVRIRRIDGWLLQQATVAAVAARRGQQPVHQQQRLALHCEVGEREPKGGAESEQKCT